MAAAASKDIKAFLLFALKDAAKQRIEAASQMRAYSVGKIEDKRRPEIKRAVKRVTVSSFRVLTTFLGGLKFLLSVYF